MKKLVLYYSYEGTTAKIAQAVADELKADIEQVCPVTEEEKKQGLSKFIWGGAQVLMKKEPRIKPISVRVEDYDMVIIGTPVWAGSCAPTIRTLLHAYDFAGQKTAFFYTDEGGPGHISDSMKRSLVKSTFLGSLELPKAKTNVEEAEKTAKKWCIKLA